MIGQTRVRILAVALLMTSCLPFSGPRPIRHAGEIIPILVPEIRAGGAATVVVLPPVRAYQQPVSSSRIAQLAHELALPFDSTSAAVPNCAWAPVDTAAAGMAITVSEFAIAGDSAVVSVLRACRERLRGRVLRFEGEPTWVLRYGKDGWHVVDRRMRVTQAWRTHLDRAA